MDLSTMENIQNTAGWPQAIEVWQFDRSKGSTNIGVRKKTQPCKVTPISQTLKDIYVKNTGSVLEDPKKSSEQLSFSLLPLKFCKKDITTGIQKQLRCKVCKCLMESTNALKAHLQSQKHSDNYGAYEKLNASVCSADIDGTSTSKSATDIPIDKNSQII